MRWLIPHEHGAYGQLGFPLAAAIASGRPGAASASLVIAFVAAFIAHEPVLVLIGERGTRAKRESYRDAVLTFGVAGTIALLAAVAGLWLMLPASRWTVAVPAAFAVAAVPMIVQRTQKTTTGELHVALTLASCALPAGVAAGVSQQKAAACWFVLTLGFWAATLAVRATIAKQRREPFAALRGWAVLLAVAGPLVTAFMAASLGLHPRLWAAALPLSILALVAAVVLPSARRLREIGWSLIGASAVASILLAFLNRMSFS
jgi:hypothetical protein